MQRIATLEPYLSQIRHPALRQDAEDAFETGDAEGFLCMLDNTQGLPCVLDNVHVFKAKGMYEKALVSAYVGTRTNWAHFPLSVIEWAFNQGDRIKLRDAGNPFPPGDSFVLYRGASGRHPFRKVSGMSWTSDLDKAIWFATRYEIASADPAVYKTTVHPDEVYCYVNDRSEQDFILRARRYQRLDILVERKPK